MTTERIRFDFWKDLHYTSVVLDSDENGYDFDSTEARGSSRLESLRALQNEIESQYKSRSALVSAEIEKELLLLAQEVGS